VKKFREQDIVTNSVKCFS